MKTVWITGASSGIGEALAYQWAQRKALVVLSSRSREGLESVKTKCLSLGGDAFVLPMDLEDPESVEKAANEFLTRHSSLDCLYLNGGLSQRSFVHDTDIEMDRKMMEINYFGNVQLTKKVLPLMVGQKFGHFIVTSSLTGKFGIPLRSSYAASKHALHGFYDTLRAEQVQNNIKVTMVCPGFIRTDISRNALGADGKPTGRMDDAQKAGMSPEKCAKRIIKATDHGKKEIYIGGKEILMVYFKRFLPFIYYYLASRVKPN